MKKSILILTLILTNLLVNGQIDAGYSSHNIDSVICDKIYNSMKKDFSKWKRIGYLKYEFTIDSTSESEKIIRITKFGYGSSEYFYISNIIVEKVSVTRNEKEVSASVTRNKDLYSKIISLIEEKEEEEYKIQKEKREKEEIQKKAELLSTLNKL